MKLSSRLILGDAKDVLSGFPKESVAACITDPPYNYEFVGHKWNTAEIKRRTQRASSPNSKILVKNIPYGSHLAGGVRNARWYERVHENIVDYENWCYEWALPLFAACLPGAPVAVFNSTRTAAHIQIALERAGFYARDILVYRRHSGIPKGFNLSAKLKKDDQESADRWEGWHSCFRNEWEAIVLVQKPLDTNYQTNVSRHGIGLFHTKTPNGAFLSNIIEGIPNRKDKSLALSHVNEKPLALMGRLIQMFVPKHRHNIVLDPFCGSGTTLVAARNYGVSYVGIDIDPDCINFCKTRLEKNSDELFSFHGEPASHL
jgi:site-specific DNA-methyltransferase (adenine-specific)